MPLLHIAHGVALIELSRNKSLVVAIIAAINPDMELMAEERP